MNEGLTLLVIVDMLASGMISVGILQRNNTNMRERADRRQLAGLTAMVLLFMGSFFVLLFSIYTKNMIAPADVEMGCAILLFLLLLACLCRTLSAARRPAKAQPGGESAVQPGGESAAQPGVHPDIPDRGAGRLLQGTGWFRGRRKTQPDESGGTGRYMRYALIYMAMAMLVICVAESILFRILEYGRQGQPFLLLGSEVDWGELRDELLAVMLVCALAGFLLSALQAFKESGHQQAKGRRDKIEEVKRYIKK